MHRFFALLCLLLSMGFAHAQAPFPATVGGTPLLLPVPQGFSEPSDALPVLRRNAEFVTMPAMRLLATFVADEDRDAVAKGTPATFRRYFMVQVLRSKESDTVTAKGFAEMKSQVTGLGPAALAQIAQDIQEQVASAGKQVGAEAGLDKLDLQVGVPKPLGVFHQTDTSVSTLMVSRASATTPTRTLGGLMALATSTVLLKGKVVFFAAYSTAETEADYEWLRAVSKRWVEAAKAGNAVTTP